MNDDGVVDVFLNVFASEEADTDLSDVISRHPSGSWPDPSDGDSGPLLGADPGGAESPPEERTPPGEPSPFWYTVGPWGLFYWQWAFVGTVGALLLMSSDTRGGRRRR